MQTGPLFRVATVTEKISENEFFSMFRIVAEFCG